MTSGLPALALPAALRAAAVLVVPLVVPPVALPVLAPAPKAAPATSRRAAAKTHHGFPWIFVPAAIAMLVLLGGAAEEVDQLAELPVTLLAIPVIRQDRIKKIELVIIGS